MKKISIFRMAMLILINSIFICGCWNYREIEKFSIVAGSAVDKGENGQYEVTVEIIRMSSGKDAKITSKTITMEGRTVLDAVRNGIAIAGKRLYWSHSKVIILSKKVASEGVIKVLDLYTRDAETREDEKILISEADSAKEIFEGQATTEDIKSMILDEIVRNQASLSKAPSIDLLQFNIESQTKGMSSVIPTVSLKQIDGQMVPQIIGAAIIKHGKLAGFLGGEETKDLIFIRGEVKGGVLVEGIQAKAISTPVSLEIFKSKTKITPVVAGKDIEMNLQIDTTVAINEIEGTEDLIDDEGRKKLEQAVAKRLKKRVESLIKKVQSEYDADIFGFGAKLHEDNVKVWQQVSNHWEEIFKDLKVNVQTRVHIKNSSVLSKTLKKGD